MFSSIDRIGRDKSLSVYPNPVTEQLFIELELNQSANAVIKIIGLDGKHVRAIEAEVFSGQNNFEIGIADLLPGIYFIEIISSKETWTTKITKI